MLHSCMKVGVSGWLREVAHCCDSTRLAGQEHTQVSRELLTRSLAIITFVLGVRKFAKETYVDT